jgi:hypothetical protein
MPGTSLRTPDLATARRLIVTEPLSPTGATEDPYYSTEVQQHFIRPYHLTVLKVWEGVIKCNFYSMASNVLKVLVMPVSATSPGPGRYRDRDDQDKWLQK